MSGELVSRCDRRSESIGAKLIAGIPAENSYQQYTVTLIIFNSYLPKAK